MTTAPTAAPEVLVDAPLSQLFRDGSRAEHEAAERSVFMTALMDGRVAPHGYAAYLAALEVAYAALETEVRTHVDHPVIGAMHDPALARVEALHRDLEHWAGPDWRGTVEVVPAGHAYADAIRDAAARWPGLLVAHHYTRYLGDLSGGQVVGRLLQRAYDLPVGARAGLEFYAFAAIPKPKPYKDAYRNGLDVLPVDAAQAQRLVVEVRRAFDLNSAVFADLGARLPAYVR